MNKSLLVAITAVLMGGAISAAQAQAPTPQPASSAQPAAAVAQRPANKAVPAPGTRQCIRDTGSHIPPPKGQCLPVAGRSYNRQDIQRTGAITVGSALRMLDPSVTVHGH